MFNIFNQVNFALPNSYANSALITSTGALANGGTFGQYTVDGLGYGPSDPICAQAALVVGLLVCFKAKVTF